MDEDVTDGLVIDVCGVDMGSLMTDAAREGMKTALDRLLTSNANGSNGFTNSIGLSGMRFRANYECRENQYKFALPDRSGS
jgi:hypothetical protein